VWEIGVDIIPPSVGGATDGVLTVRTYSLEIQEECCIVNTERLLRGAHMPCEVIEKEEGLITIKISGMLKRAELAQAEKVAIEAMSPAHKMKFLILTENFEGWDTKSNWEDVSFQSEYDEQIEKIAIVGEKRWQELAEVFVGKGLRSMEIRFFPSSETAKARAWIK
jgi:hypothetical protein